MAYPSSQYAPPPRKPRGGKVLLVVILAVVGLCGMCGIGLVAAPSGAFGTSHDDLRAMRDRDLGGLPDVRVAREEEGGTASCLRCAPS